MRPFLSGLLYGSVIAVILSWGQYFFGDKPANYIILLVLFLAAHLVFSFFRIRSGRFYLYLSLIFLGGLPFLVYYSEIFPIRKDIALFTATLISAFMLNQFRTQKSNIIFLPGIVIGICSFWLHPIIPQILLSVSFIFLIWTEYNLSFAVRIIHMLFLACAIAYVYKLPLYPSQDKVPEKVIGEIQEQNDHLVISRIKNNKNFYLNKKRILSTAEYHSFAESQVVPFLYTEPDERLQVLIIGGENGIVLSAINKLMPNARIECFAFRTKIQKNILFHIDAFEALDADNVTLQKIDDANSMLQYRWEQPYDLIFVDPLQNTHYDYSNLYSLEFFKKLYTLLPEDGRLIVNGFNDDLYPRSNQLVFNTLQNIDDNPHTYQLPLNTGGLMKWFVLPKQAIQDSHIEDEHDLEWYTASTYDWIAKSGKQIISTQDLIHTQDNQYLRRIKNKDSLNAILNY